MTEETKTEEKKPEESGPKSADEMTDAASIVIQYLRGKGFAMEDAICVFALASSLVQVELMMKMILKNAKVIAVPVQPSNVMVQKPSSN